MKRLITSMLIVLLLCVAFIGSFYKGYYCYAIENEDSYRALTNDELDAALYAYMQSRGGGLSAISYEAMHTYNRGKIDNAIFGDGAEYTRSDLLGHIHVGKNQNDGMYFDFDGIASGFLNTRFRKMLQDKVFGDNASLNENGMLNSGVDDTLYSGRYFTDDQGNSCLVFEYNSSSNPSTVTPISIGTPYLMNVDDLIVKLQQKSSFTKSQSYNNISYTYYVDCVSYSSNGGMKLLNFNVNNSNTNTTLLYYGIRDDAYTHLGYLAIGFNTNNNKYYVGAYKYYQNSSTSIFYPKFLLNTTSLDINNSTAVDINFYTNNILQTDFNITDYPDIDADGHLYVSPKVKINGEYSPYTVNNNQTINQVINNYYNDGSEKDKTITVPTTSPDSGSGGSGGSGGTPPNWSNPYPNLSPDGNGGFNFNFTLPDLNIDWNISGLSEKFPFSIPFDLIRFITVLNAEPETPHFEGTINLIVYQWDIDADLSQFDNLASIVRNVEFIGFCITLVLITRRMIKG